MDRLSILSLNVGSLSGFLWTEIKAYIASQKCEADFILLQEVHWRQTCSFRVGGWSAFVSATAERADGVMILAHPRYQDSQLKFDEAVRGRVLRVQVSLQKEKVELFCVYQRVWQNQLSKSDNIEQRQSLLSKLAAQIRSIAKRSTVIVAGDFNAEVLPTPGRVGRCVPKTPRHVGPESPDPRALTRFVEETEMVVLNTWCLRDPLTYHSTTGSSQIELIMVRAPSADHRARQCYPAEPPVGSWRSMGHRSLHASIRLVKHYHIQAPAKQRPTLNIKALQEQARSGGADIDRLRSDVRSEVAAMSHSDPDEALQTLLSCARLHALSQGKLPLSAPPPSTSYRCGSSAPRSASIGEGTCRASLRHGDFLISTRGWRRRPGEHMWRPSGPTRGSCLAKPSRRRKPTFLTRCTSWSAALSHGSLALSLD